MATDDVPVLAAVPALPVSDVARAVRFWRDAFGFEQVLHEGEPQGIVRSGGAEVHLWVPDGVHEGAELHLIGSASCRIEVGDAAALHARSAELGVVHPSAPLRETAWGTREFAVLDPDGNLVGVFERILDGASAEQDLVAGARAGTDVQVLGTNWVGTRTAARDAVVALFHDVLGLGVLADAEGFTVLEAADGSTFEVFGPESPYNAHVASPVAGFRVADLLVADRALRAAGVDVVLPVSGGQERRWLHFRAPDGHLYELNEVRAR